MLSVIVACLAALAALAVVDRVVALRLRDGRPHSTWLGIGAVTMGSGIWAMHFTGMLAFEMPVKMSYGLAITMASMLPATIGSWFALRFMVRDTIEWWRLQLAALALAVGIGTMHYLGMEAMILDAKMRYKFSLFVFSILVAYLLAATSLYLRFVFNRRQLKIDTEVQTLFSNFSPNRLLSVVVLGSAVSGMHYTAMSSLRFFASPTLTVPSMILPPSLMATIIAVIVLLMAVLTVIGTIIDQRLTEASDSVLDSAARYDAVLEAMADGFIVLNEDESIETFNPAAEKLFGYHTSEVIDTPLSKLLSSGETRRIVDHYLATGDSYVRGLGIEIAGLRKDGTTFPLEVTVSKLAIRGRSLFTFSTRDIGPRQAVEQQLAQSQKLESIGQLAAGIAHELNTPAQYVSDNTHFLDESFGDIIKPLKRISEIVHQEEEAIQSAQIAEMKEAIGEADVDFLSEEIPRAIAQSLEGLGRVSKIVGAMKEFSHPSSEKSLVDLNRAIESTITVATNEWKYVANLETEFDPDLPHIPCLLGEFNQVILNLVVNACHAIASANGQNGEVKGKITVSTRADGDWVEVRILDTGTGIPKEIQKKIFDPFFTTKKVGKGTGQGLSIAHSVIVKKHGGTLDVESQVGTGTCFIIRLPSEEPVSTASDVRPA